MRGIVRPAGGIYWGSGGVSAPRVRTCHISWPGQPFSALFLSDLHIRDAGGAVQETLLAVIKREKPALLLLGGDLAESAEAAQAFLAALGALDTPLGKYLAVGNNDVECADGSIRTLRAWCRQGGVHLLYNRSVTVELRGGKLSIGGVDEMKYGQPIGREVFSAAQAHNFKILLSHYPDRRIPEKMRVPPDLMLSGHTHGGQLAPLGITPYVLPFFEPYLHLPCVRGEAQVGNTHLIVSAGVGMSSLPLRIGAPPEIHLLKFST